MAVGKHEFLAGVLARGGGAGVGFCARICRGRPLAAGEGPGREASYSASLELRLAPHGPVAAGGS